MTKRKTRESLVGAGLLVLCGTAGAHENFEIIPTCLNSVGELWTADRIAVFESVLHDWEHVLEMPESLGFVEFDVLVEFTRAGTGGYLAQWVGTWDGVSTGDSTRPWSRTTHVIHFNADLFATDQDNYAWWDPTPETDGDVPAEAWDLLTAARQEVGHMLGFTDSLYRDEIGTVDEVDRWGSRISISGSTATFDSGGLNVALASASDLAHLSGSGATSMDLMSPSLPTGVRRDISNLDLSMLALAYDYSFIPEPGITSALVLFLGLATMRRRREH